jgi:hypothetical protein
MAKRIMSAVQMSHSLELAARVREETGQCFWNIGICDELKLRQVEISEWVLENCGDGFTVIECQGFPHRLYVYRDSTEFRLEIGLRQDWVEMWGEAKVRELEKLIHGQSPTVGPA